MSHTPPASPVTLTNCDTEPIHIPGLIQPHGVLLALSPHDLTIQQISANCQELLGISAQEALGKSLGNLLEAPSAKVTLEELQKLRSSSKPSYLPSVESKGNDQVFDAIAHRSISGPIILELEPANSNAARAGIELYRLVDNSNAALQHCKTLHEMYDACARQVRTISGFDRVMIYRFNPEWHGEVIAEARREDLEPFLGLHYPASDIPVQARILYSKNRLRFIPHCSYKPSPVVPTLLPGTQMPLDLSFSVLRSVSPIHLEYLANMGVGASMSISLMKSDRLWGLIACHNYSPRLVPYNIRTACELLGRTMSLELTTKEDQELAAYSEQMKSTRERLFDRLSSETNIHTALLSGAPNLMNFIDATGAAILVDDEIHRIGQTPGPDEMNQIAEFVQQHAEDGIYATDAAGEKLHHGTLDIVAAGVLGITLTSVRRLQILWFRPEQVRTVDWAGDPSKNVAKGSQGVRLSPRGSFALWKETVRGHSLPWAPSELAAAKDFRRDISTLLLGRAEKLATELRSMQIAGERVNLMLDSERSARAEAERINRMKDQFLATLSHELRTPLNAILGWSHVLRKSGKDSPEILNAIDVIDRNTRSQVKMIDDLLDVNRIVSGKLRLDVQVVQLPVVLEGAIETMLPAAHAKSLRVEKMIDPMPGVEFTGDPARLLQVFSNLLFNAMKFTPKGGRIQVLLERVNSHVEVTVSDTGKGIAAEFLPHVFDRFRQEDSTSTRSHGGLGLGLSIVRSLVELHGGTVRAESAGVNRGATFVVSLPVRILKTTESDTRQHPKSDSNLLEVKSLNYTGLHILAIDDERDSRELIQRVLEDVGAKVTTAESAADAFELIKKEKFTLIVSDIGMPLEDGYSMIRRIREWEQQSGAPHTPAIALTAYARPADRQRALLMGFHAHMSKPVEAWDLLTTVASLTGRIAWNN